MILNETISFTFWTIVWCHALIPLDSDSPLVSDCAHLTLIVYYAGSPTKGLITTAEGVSRAIQQ